jgi:hypothetical protein
LIEAPGAPPSSSCWLAKFWRKRSISEPCDAKKRQRLAKRRLPVWHSHPQLYEHLEPDSDPAVPAALHLGHLRATRRIRTSHRRAACCKTRTGGPCWRLPCRLCAAPPRRRSDRAACLRLVLHRESAHGQAAAAGVALVEMPLVERHSSRWLTGRGRLG